MEVRMGILELRNQHLDAEVARLVEEKRTMHHRCVELMQSAFMSGLVALNNEAVGGTQPPILQFATMPQNADPRPMSPEVTELYVRPARTAKRTLEETSQVIDRLEDLPEEFRTRIQPFYQPGKNATNDKLNDCQRAFMKFCADRLVQSGERLTPALAESIRMEGIDERLWKTDYQVENGKDFCSYLQSRLKNERKKIRARELERNSADRMSQFLDKEMNL